MRTDVRIEHRYPDALPFLQEHAPTPSPFSTISLPALRYATASPSSRRARKIAEDLFISKDTVHRRSASSTAPESSSSSRPRPPSNLRRTWSP